MLTSTILDRLSGSSNKDNNPPRINVGNALPSGYVIVTLGAGFWYRRNQSQDPETAIKENLSIETGEQDTIHGTRRDCCRLAQLFVDVQTPNGDIVLVSKTLEPPSGQCIIQESLVLEANAFASGTTLDLTFKSM
jgi:hypothetical protein